jgi:hypothetical protein
MPTWNEVNHEIDQVITSQPVDIVRKKYIQKLESRVGRTVIAYYSCFLQHKPHPEVAITDLDMNGMMAVIHGVDRTKGLDLILHTPGGGLEAARGLMEYLYKMFGSDIRAVIPQMAMSAGTLIACGCKEILMGKHSCLGPTDPQVRGLPAMGVLAEVDQAIEEIKKDRAKEIVWQQVFGKYPPAFILDCERSVAGTRQMVTTWLQNNMFKDKTNKIAIAKGILEQLMNYKGTTDHSHHFTIDKCQEIGLKVTALEDDQGLQEDVLTLHHAYVATFARTNTIKIIENGRGGTWTVLSDS